MDKAEKTLLKVIIARLGALRTSTIRRYMFQILNALAYCHDQGK